MYQNVLEADVRSSEEFAEMADQPKVVRSVVTLSDNSSYEARVLPVIRLDAETGRWQPLKIVQFERTDAVGQAEQIVAELWSGNRDAGVDAVGPADVAAPVELAPIA